MHIRSVLRAVSLTTLITASLTAATLEDFESFNAGSLNGQGNWSTTAGVEVILDATSSSKMMHLDGSNQNAYLPLNALSIADGSVGTLFFRFQTESTSLNHALGLSDVAEPNDWGHYETTARFYPDSGSMKVQGRNGNNYANMTLNGGAGGLSNDTWYHLWVVNDNTTDTADFYLQGGSITTQRQVADDFAFRNGTGSALSTLLARTGSGTSTGVFIDDIHVSAGVDLSSPIGAPGTGAVVIDDGTTPPDRTAIGLDLPALYNFAGQRLLDADAAIASNRMPERTGGSTWGTTTAGGWTSGFFAGELWMMYRQTGDAQFLNAAKARTSALNGQENNGGNHDVGFRVFNSFGQGYVSLDDGDADKADYFDRILTAAGTLANRYRPTYQAIESWSNGDVIIDNMMNLELLMWAADHTTDQTKAQLWRNIAITHALTTMNEHVRADGSTYHVVRFNETTGEVEHKRTAQGYNNESTWTRGHGWGIYGFTMMYRFTSDQRFLDTAIAMTEYWLANMPADGVVPYDFDDPDSDVPLDSSASALTASALLELMEYVNAADAQRYFHAAETMLEGLADLDVLTNGLDWISILREGSVKKGQHERGLIYGDYYFIEALQRYEAIIPEPATVFLVLAGTIMTVRRRVW